MAKRATKKSNAGAAQDTNDHGVGEIQVQKSPAEFFAENQAIAGFDNMGKSLYTTVRELIENGLDACEMVHQLPSISVHIQEYTQNEFNKLTTNDLRLDPTSTTNAMKDNYLLPDRNDHEQIDTKLFEKKGSRKKLNSEKVENVESIDHNIEQNNEATKSKKATDPSPSTGSKQNQYYLITVVDNGCGMEHTAIPNMFGRVLSGSKYGVRQTRGKFGLGAKMALIWSKKSTGHPIHIITAHELHRSTTCNSVISDSVRETRTPPTHISSCILDIDIYRNEPRVLEHTKTINKTGFVGTTVRVLIAGNWTTYKSRIVQYLQQLAIITPYAELSLTYTECTGKRDIHMLFHRRSEQMPDMPSTVKHHPASVNNIIIQQLIQNTRSKNLISFLTNELQAISITLAKRLITELEEAAGLHVDMKPTDLSDKQITRLVQLFHQVQLFRPPDGTCLSPLGEYNLNLGIHKVLEPEYIATTRDKVSVYEGHPFVIEAAVSLGGNYAKEGVTVYRFANRIPLLFEGGADVATRVALTKIKWSNYKIDYKKDKVGVFVSIVSTKIPFKGTSKEYIGDDGRLLLVFVANIDNQFLSLLICFCFFLFFSN
jgi:DNA topoisomerase VI subunit B